MKKREVKLDDFKGENPFKVPEGYMEGLTDRIMSDLPELEVEDERPVTLMDHIRPWLYLAAVFAGLGLFFKAVVHLDGHDSATDSLLVRTEIPAESMETIISDDDLEYLEYLEEEYVDYIIEEDMIYSE